MSNPALQCKGVSKYFFKKRFPGSKGNGQKNPVTVAVADINLEVASQETLGVVGPNGSGKSTLIRLISTLLYPDSGTILVFGHDVVKEARIVKTMINRVSVEASFFKKLSALENLSYGAKLYGITGNAMRKEVFRILDRIGFSRTRVNEPMGNLSRGMQQKVALARALLTAPVLMLLDEPTTGLDPRSKKDVQEFIREIRQEHGATTILCTHDMDEAEKLCDRVAFLIEGRVVALDTPSNLIKAYSPDGREVDLEGVFMEITGRSLAEEKDL